MSVGITCYHNLQSDFFLSITLDCESLIGVLVSVIPLLEEGGGIMPEIYKHLYFYTYNVTHNENKNPIISDFFLVVCCE